MGEDAWGKEVATDVEANFPKCICKLTICLRCSGRTFKNSVPPTREPWYAVCCKTLALKRGYWAKLQEYWDDESDDETDLAAARDTLPDETDVAKQDAFCQTDQAAADDGDDDEVFYSDCHSEAQSACSTPKRHGRPDFTGTWKCVETWGMDEFLTATGVPWVRRKAATRAPWPVWEFEQQTDRLIFINRTALGDIREEVKLDGAKYIFRDGWKQQVASAASWDGDRLVIDRDGPQGNFREERYLDDEGRLQFRMHAAPSGKLGGDATTIGRQSFKGKKSGVDVQWGRTFVRKVC